MACQASSDVEINEKEHEPLKINISTANSEIIKDTSAYIPLVVWAVSACQENEIKTVIHEQQNVKIDYTPSHGQVFCQRVT